MSSTSTIQCEMCEFTFFIALPMAPAMAPMARMGPATLRQSVQRGEDQTLARVHLDMESVAQVLRD